MSLPAAAGAPHPGAAAPAWHHLVILVGQLLDQVRETPPMWCL